MNDITKTYDKIKSEIYPTPPKKKNQQQKNKIVWIQPWW